MIRKAERRTGGNGGRLTVTWLVLTPTVTVLTGISLHSLFLMFSVSQAHSCLFLLPPCKCRGARHTDPMSDVNTNTHTHTHSHGQTHTLVWWVERLRWVGVKKKGGDGDPRVYL